MLWSVVPKDAKSFVASIKAGRVELLPGVILSEMIRSYGDIPD